MLLTLPEMKKRILLYVLLFLAVIIQSCGTEERLEASGDFVYQKYSGPSYPFSSGDEVSAGANVGFSIIGGLAGSGVQSGGYNKRSSDFSNPYYANAQKGPSSFLNLNSQDSHPSTSYKQRKSIR